MRNVLCGIAASLCLTGCAGGTYVYNTDFQPQFQITGGVKLGGIRPVETYGPPPAGLTAEEFVALMRAPGWYQPTRFALAGPGERGYRFVVAFGTDVVTPLCDRPKGGGNPGLVAAALCLGDTQISRAAARLRPGPDVSRDVDALMFGLLPPPRYEGRDPPCLVPGGC